MVDQLQVALHTAADTLVLKLLGHAGAVGGEREFFAPGFEIVLAERVLNVDDDLGPAAHQVHAATQQVAGAPHAGRIDVRLRQHAAAQQRRNLVAVEFIVLGLPSMKGSHIQRMPQHEVDPFVGAQVGQPVPGEHALDGYYEVLPIGLDHAQELFPAGLQVAVQERFAGRIDNAHVHRLGV